MAVASLVAAGCAGEEPRSAQDAVDAWAAAISDGRWERACELEYGPRPDCAARRASIYHDAGEQVRPAGRYQEGGRLLHTVESPVGPTALEVRRVDGRWRVHPEIQVIR